jgi:hypothetical protein
LASCTSTGTSTSCPRVPRLLPFRWSLQEVTAPMNLAFSISQPPRAPIRPLITAPVCVHSPYPSFSLYLGASVANPPSALRPSRSFQLSTCRLSTPLFPSNPFFFKRLRILRRSLSFPKTPTPLQSSKYELLRKNTRGGGYLPTFNCRLSTPPPHTPALPEHQTCGIQSIRGS